MRYDYYIFDFDGTIAETGEGIRKSVAYSLEKMGRAPLNEAVLNRFIGPPLHGAYMEYCGMTDGEATEAVAAYRERYTKIGLFESYLYPGIETLLRTLRDRGAWVAIASGKPEVMVRTLVSHFGMDDAFDRIVGITLDRKDADKQDLILNALPEGADPARVCMVGDRCFDIDAAVALGMDGVGAGYGYGLEGELERSGAKVVFKDAASMAAWLTGEN